MKKLIFLLLVITSVSYPQRLGFRGNAGTRGLTTSDSGLVITGDLDVSGGIRVQGTSDLVSTVTITAVTKVSNSIKVYDTDSDSLILNPKGFSATNSAAVGTKVLQYKDGSTNLFNVDSTGILNAKTGVFDDSLRVEKTSLVKGKASLTDSLAVTKGIRNESILTQKGKATVNDSLVTIKGFRNESISTLKGNVAANTKLTIGDSLRVEKTSILKGDVTINGAILNNKSILDKTDTYQMTSGDVGKTIVFTKATIDTILWHTSPAVGFRITIVKASTGKLVVKAPASYKIADSGVADTIFNDTAELFACITLQVVSASQILLENGVGTWTTTD